MYSFNQLSSRRALAKALVAAILVATSSGQSSAADGLSQFYIHYQPFPQSPYPLSEPTRNPPALTVVGGGANPPPIFGGTLTVDSFLALGVDARANGAKYIYISGPRTTPCRTTSTQFTLPLDSPGQLVDGSTWYDRQNCFSPPFPSGATWVTNDVLTYANPVRRKAVDGGQYDASPMILVRNGQPWMTYHWGYRLGLVASAANWNPANLPKVPELATWPSFPDAKDNFELVSLPPSWVEDDVIEYVNRADFPAQPGGQYFYAVLASDKTLLDSIPNWQRSGKSFKSGGYVSACRFYGGKNGGPNTHFYSADDKECTAVKAIPQLSYEGQTFAVNVPLPGANADGSKPCPIDSKALYRVYNNASASNGRFVSNHRYLTEKADVATVVAQGWVDEGQAMCVPQ